MPRVKVFQNKETGSIVGRSGFAAEGVRQQRLTRGACRLADAVPR
jgi:hypothetical protein